MLRLSFIEVIMLLGLTGCAAGAGIGTGAANAGLGLLGNVQGAATSGGTLTPITNLGDAYALQKLADSHNLMVAARRVLAASGMVTVTTAPPVVTVQPVP